MKKFPGTISVMMAVKARKNAASWELDFFGIAKKIRF